MELAMKKIWLVKIIVEYQQKQFIDISVCICRFSGGAS